MSQVLPLTRWKNKSLAEREEFSDEEEDSENEDIGSDVQELPIPRKSRKRKISSGDKKAKKPRLRIPKKSVLKRPAQDPPGPPPGRPPKRPRPVLKASQIPSKN